MADSLRDSSGRDGDPAGRDAADRADLALSTALRASHGQWLLPDVLAGRLGLDERGLRAALRRLREAGHQVEVRPGGALRLVAGADRLDPAEILHDLKTHIIGCSLSVAPETASTNDLAWSALAGGAPDGACFFAEHQTEGRGRLGRRWFAPPCTAVLMSTGVRRRDSSAPHPTDSSLLTFAASIATAEAIVAAARVPCAIEWPNDVLCRGRKAAGILVEGRIVAGRPALVLGVGINANVPLGDLPPEVHQTATSLAAEAGRPVDRVLLARHLLVALDRWYAVAAAGDAARIERRWLELSATVGRRLTLAQDGRTFEGVVVDVSPMDGLALRLAHGEIRHFLAESTTVVRRAAP
jgi:BirA family biotin operon repressor/biotin-[acetyl-CoA-carboxylase] ligase